MNFLKKRWQIFLVLMIEVLVVVAAIGKCLSDDRYVMDFPGDGILGYEQAIALERGSYVVELSYHTQQDGVYCQTMTNTSYGMVASDEISLPKELTKKQFEVRLDESTEMFFLMVASSADETQNNEVQIEEFVSLESISVRETNQMDRAKCVALVFLFLLVDCAWVLRRTPKWEKLEAQQKTTALVLIGIWLLASMPLFVNYMVTGDDFVFHMMRIEGIAKGLQSGQFPVKMQPGWMNGYGYPVSVMYGDVLLYFPALLRVAGFTLQAAYKCYILAINGITVLSAYYCAKKFTGERKYGILGSLIFSMSAYRLLNLYFRCSVGEYTAMAFFPLALVGLHLVLHTAEKRKGQLCLIVAYTLILQSHLLSCEMILLFSALYCVLQWKFFWKNLRHIISAAGITLVCNLGFLIPFLDYMNCQDLWIKGGASGNMQEHGLFVAQLFQTFEYGGVGSGSVYGGIASDMPISLGMVFLVLMALFVWEFLVHGKDICAKVGAENWREQCSIFGMMLLSIWMSCYFFPWNEIKKIPLLGNALTVYQFAWRFLAIAVTLGSVLSGLVIKNMRQFLSRESVRVAMLGLGLLSLLQGIYLMDSRMASAEVIYVNDTSGMNSVYAVSGGEYLLQGAQRDQTYDTEVVGGDGVWIELREREETYFRIACENNGETESWVKIPLFAYKGYRAYDVDSGTELTLSFEQDRILKVILPAGYQGEVEVVFREPMSWRLAELISAFGFVTLIVLILQEKKPLRNR